MIILKKKKIITLICLIILGISIGILKNGKNKSIVTVAFPVSNKVIVIDAGHGIPDERGRKQRRYI